MADAGDLKSPSRKRVWVRLPYPAPINMKCKGCQKELPKDHKRTDGYCTAKCFRYWRWKDNKFNQRLKESRLRFKFWHIE